MQYELFIFKSKLLSIKKFIQNEVIFLKLFWRKPDSCIIWGLDLACSRQIHVYNKTFSVLLQF